jgi:hypothetical protein
MGAQSRRMKSRRARIIRRPRSLSRRVIRFSIVNYME